MVKDTSNSHCYVIPVGTNKTAGRELRNFLKSYDGREADVHLAGVYKVKLLPGVIADTSFLPPEAGAECSDFSWLSVIGESK